jgi:hypothetical protein
MNDRKPIGSSDQVDDFALCGLQKKDADIAKRAPIYPRRQNDALQFDYSAFVKVPASKYRDRVRFFGNAESGKNSGLRRTMLLHFWS